MVMKDIIFHSLFLVVVIVVVEVVVVAAVNEAGCFLYIYLIEILHIYPANLFSLFTVLFPLSTLIHFILSLDTA